MQKGFARAKPFLSKDLALFERDQFDAAVRFATGTALVVGDGTAGSVTDRSNAGFIDAFLDEVAGDRLGALFGKLLVVVGRSDFVRVALDLELRLRMLLHQPDDVVERSVTALYERR